MLGPPAGGQWLGRASYSFKHLGLVHGPIPSINGSTDPSLASVVVLPFPVCHLHEKVPRCLNNYCKRTGSIIHSYRSIDWHTRGCANKEGAGMPCGSIHRRLASLVLNCYFVSGKINYRVSVIIDRYSMLVPIEFGVLWPRRQFWGYFLVIFSCMNQTF